MEMAENLIQHRTDGFRAFKELVVRRGAPFKISLQLKGRPFNPYTDQLKLKIITGHLYAVMTVSYNPKRSLSRWTAFIDLSSVNPLEPSVYICSPALAPIGRYRFVVCAFTTEGQSLCTVGKFILLCNPWCTEDTVFMPSEDQREEYVLSDSGLLFTGTTMNPVLRPWSFDQFESGVLEACLNVLEVSPLHQFNQKMDDMKRHDPVYLSRVVSAMVNSDDDKGVLTGNWTGDFKQGMNPSAWTSSGDILRQWVQSGYSPVKYGQCWVFAAVMCTVMRALGIPCRVVTNFNSAHDTNGNLVIEEYYTKTGQKLNYCKDSIWNFHVWVECWMSRPDMGLDMDGWQVLDPTPQEKSGGVFCCGPAPVRAIRERRIDLVYDVPFVYAEVNADVHTIIVSQGHVVKVKKDRDRVGALICTKAVGVPMAQNITGEYKMIQSPISTMWSSSRYSDGSTMRSSSGCSDGSTMRSSSGRSDGFAWMSSSGCSDGSTMRSSSGRSDGCWSSSGYSDGSTLRSSLGRSDGLWSSSGYSDGSTMRSSSGRSDGSTLRRASPAANGVTVCLILDKAPVPGEPIRFTVKIINNHNKAKHLKMHLNAQAKEYNNSPSDTFWESHGVAQMGPGEVKIIQQQILPAQYEDVVGDNLINLAVVLEDMSTLEQVLATEEFNIASPELVIKIANEGSVMVNKEQIATIMFTNPFSHPVSGDMTVTGAGLIQDKVSYRLPPLKAGGSFKQAISFIPRNAGSKMLQAILILKDGKSTVRGFKMVSAKRA